MRTVRSVAEMRAALAGARANGRTVGLVPTMGAFHEGHISLMRRARAECDLVVVSLFVNPTQFGAGEDFDRYPRDEQRDAALAAEAGVDLLFSPPAAEVYPDGFSTRVSAGPLGKILCGGPASRGRAHFEGVATVVIKLLNMCSPDVAYFGQKDHQQTLLIRRVVTDLDIPVRIEVCPTVRDADGLALSSRNAYLSPAERRRAAALKRALDAAVAVIAAGGTRGNATGAARTRLEAAGVRPEYIEVLRAEDLLAPRWEPGERLVVAVAGPVGGTRLIDNALAEVGSPADRGATAPGLDDTARAAGDGTRDRSRAVPVAVSARS